jgi:hypothetical protein
LAGVVVSGELALMPASASESVERSASSETGVGWEAEGVAA